MAFRTAQSSAAHLPARLPGHTRARRQMVPRFSTSQATFPGAAPYKVTLWSGRTDLRKCPGLSAAAIRFSAPPLPSRALSYCSELGWRGYLLLPPFTERNCSREDPRRYCTEENLRLLSKRARGERTFDRGQMFHRLPLL